MSSPEDLLALPLIEVLGVSHSWQQWFDKAEVAIQPEQLIVHKVDTLLSALLMVESGLGVMLAYPDLLTKQFLKREVVAPFEVLLPTKDNYFLASPQGRPLSKSANVFRSWLLAEMAFFSDTER